MTIMHDILSDEVLRIFGVLYPNNHAEIFLSPFVLMK